VQTHHTIFHLSPPCNSSRDVEYCSQQRTDSAVKNVTSFSSRTERTGRLSHPDTITQHRGRHQKRTWHPLLSCSLVSLFHGPLLLQRTQVLLFKNTKNAEWFLSYFPSSRKSVIRAGIHRFPYCSLHRCVPKVPSRNRTITVNYNVVHKDLASYARNGGRNACGSSCKVSVTVVRF
jgi:hypothetical protein